MENYYYIASSNTSYKLGMIYLLLYSIKILVLRKGTRRSRYIVIGRVSRSIV